jgi:hypothetical protein
MRKVFVSVIVLGLLAIPMMAQDHSKVEVFGGYQYSHYGSSFSPVSVADGWDTSLTYKVNRTFGVTADFTGAYHTISAASIGTPVDVRFYTYAVGPEASFKVGCLEPFVHMLFGGAHLSASASSAGAHASESVNGLTVMMGTGADVKINRHFSLRLIQADWVYYYFDSSALLSKSVNSGDNAKIASGVVVRF